MFGTEPQGAVGTPSDVILKGERVSDAGKKYVAYPLPIPPRRESHAVPLLQRGHDNR